MGLDYHGTIVTIVTLETEPVVSMLKLFITSNFPRMSFCIKLSRGFVSGKICNKKNCFKGLITCEMNINYYGNETLWQ